jgi:hypothetical protein
MKLTRLTVVLPAALIALGGTAAGTAIAASSSPAATPQYVLISYCGDHGNVRPSTEDLPGCMPSNELMNKLKWVSWRSVAYGSGNLAVNNCSPSSSCGPAKFTKYPVLIVLWRPEAWSGHAGRDYFSRITWIFTGKRPSHTPVTQTSVLPAH